MNFEICSLRVPNLWKNIPVENISVAVYNIKSYLAFSKCLFPFPCPQKTLGIIILYGDDMDQMYFVLGSW